MELKIPDHLRKVKEVELTKQDLEEFEEEIKTAWETANISGPVHLSKGNEDQLVEVFQYVHPQDWVFSTWRNHLHALLHGIPRQWLADEILNARSMKVMNAQYKFYTSAIVGGILPIALGVAHSLKQKGSSNKVWAFVGDMTLETGIFHECYKYSRNFQLPLEFVIEDNNLSTNTPTDEAWGQKQSIPDDVIYYTYERGYPHHGSGSWVLF